MASPKSPCVICLEPNVRFRGKLSTCSHVFCFDCIKEWSHKSNTCPLCKLKFRCISEVNTENGSVISKKRVGEKSQYSSDEFDEFDISTDDISQMRISLKNKYSTRNFYNEDSDDDDDDLDDFIQPDHSRVKVKEILDDSFDFDVSPSHEQKRVTQNLLSGSKMAISSQPRKTRSRSNKIQIDEEVLENIRKFGHTGWISKK